MRRALLTILVVLAVLAAGVGVLSGRPDRRVTRYACGQTVDYVPTTVWASGAGWDLGTGDGLLLFRTTAGSRYAGRLAGGIWLTCANSFLGRPMVSTAGSHEFVWWIDLPDGDPVTPAPTETDTLVLGSFAGPAGVGRRRVPGGYAFVATLPIQDCDAVRPAALLTNANVTNAWNLAPCSPR